MSKEIFYAYADTDNMQQDDVDPHNTRDGNSRGLELVGLPHPAELTVTGNDGQVYVVQAEMMEQYEEPNGTMENELNFTYAIDRSNGNLILIHDGQSLNVNCIPEGAEEQPENANVGNFSEQANLNMAHIQIHGLNESENNEFTLADIQPLASNLSSEMQESQFNLIDNSQIMLDDKFELGVEQSELRVSNVTSMVNDSSSRADSTRSPVTPDTDKSCLWSRRKTAELIQCIFRHEDKFRERLKAKTFIWNDISKDMSALGHEDCNRDECNKKWSNLYRTWKIVKLRPRASREKWEYYSDVSNLVKSLSARYRDKSISKNSQSRSVKDLIAQLTSSNKKHQEAIELAESQFQLRVSVLDKERDEMLNDINKLLQSVSTNSDKDKFSHKLEYFNVLESAYKTGNLYYIRVPQHVDTENLNHFEDLGENIVLDHQNSQCSEVKPSLQLH